MALFNWGKKKEEKARTVDDLAYEYLARKRSAAAMYGSRGSSITLDDLSRTYGMEPYAIIRLAAYFAKLGIKTEEDAIKLMKELNSV